MARIDEAERLRDAPDRPTLLASLKLLTGAVKRVENPVPRNDPESLVKSEVEPCVSILDTKVNVGDCDGMLLLDEA